MDTVGIVGLGVMGSNCAKKLMESGVPVAGYDPYPPAVKRASEAGVSMCGSPAELAGKAPYLMGVFGITAADIAKAARKAIARK